jgi:hypothetical protein
MPTDLPIACSLSETELPARLAEIRALGQDALLSARRVGPRAVLRFTSDPDIRARVEAIVAAESRCCAFLTMRISAEPDTVTLTIEAPEDAELVLQELVDAFGVRAQPA